MTDISVVPPFIVFQRPVFRYSTADGGNDSSSSSRNEPSRVARVFVDEVASDVVIFSADSCEVCFYHLQLRKTSNRADSVIPSPLRHDNGVSAAGEMERLQEEEEWLRHHPSLPSDAIALRVKCAYDQRGEMLTIRHAKRCSTALYKNSKGDGSSSRGSRAYLVALSFNTEQVFFFRCHHHLAVEPLAAVATFRCAPRNLRFREEFYPIHAFYWAEQLQGAGHAERCHVSLTTPHTECPRQDGEEPEGTILSHPAEAALAGTSTFRILLCITSISIDLVGVDVERIPPPPPSSPSSAARTGGDSDSDSALTVAATSGKFCVLLRRYPTHTDYWHYSPVARTFLSVNKLKPYFVKTFEVRGRDLRTMPTLRLEEGLCASRGNDAASSLFYSPACMDVPAIQYPIAFLVLQRHLFICSASCRDGCLVLFRCVCSAEGSDAWSFVKHAVLRAEFPMDAWREPVTLQVVDNLILLHALQTGLTTVFDIICSEKQKDAFISAAPTASLANPSTTSSVMERSALGMQSSKGSIASFVEGDTSVKEGNSHSASWITRLANGLRNCGDNIIAHNSTHSSGGDSVGGCCCCCCCCCCHETQARNDGDASVPVPVLQPLLSAALSFYPPLPSSASAAIDRNNHYSHNFIFGTLPLLLDRQNGMVSLVGVNPFAIAAAMPVGPRRVQFYLHRMQSAGRAVPSMVRAMLTVQENLAVVAQTFEMVTTYHATQRQLVLPPSGKRREGIPHWKRAILCFGVVAPEASGRSAVLFSGPASALCRWLPKEDAEGPLPSCPPWRRWSGLTLQEVLSTCTTPSAAECEPVAACCLDARIGQFAMQRDVFVPLADAVLSAGGVADANITTTTASGLTAPEAARGPKLGIEPSDAVVVSSGQKYFVRYLFYALLEYAWCVLQKGSVFSDGLQRILLRLLHASSPVCEFPHQLLLPGVITDQVPTAMLLLHMGDDWRQLGFEMLSRLQADALIIQELLERRQPLEAAKFLFSEEHQRKNRHRQEPLCVKTMGSILQCAMDVLLDDERDGYVCRTRRGFFHFVAVYEMITSFLLQHPLAKGMLPPPQLLRAAEKYHQLMSDGGLGKGL